jgi:hypothetical protein
LVEDLLAFVGFVIDPKDVVVYCLWHLSRSISFLEVVDSEVEKIISAFRISYLDVSFDFGYDEFTKRFKEKLLLVAEV